LIRYWIEFISLESDSFSLSPPKVAAKYGEESA